MYRKGITMVKSFLVMVRGLACSCSGPFRSMELNVD